MAWSTITNGEIDAESRITTGLMTKYRDNLAAVAAQGFGAPTLPFRRIYYAEEQKANNVNSATALADGVAVARRDLVEVMDTLGAAGGGGGSIAGANDSQITLAAGTYWVEAAAVCYAQLFCDDVDPQGISTLAVGHKLALYNTSDASFELDGESDHFGIIGPTYSGPPARTSTQSQTAHLSGRFTIAFSKTFELRHYVNHTQAGDLQWIPSLKGGVATDYGAQGEIYARIRFFQIIVG